MEYVSASFEVPPKYPALQFFHHLHRLYAANYRLLLTIVTPAALFSAIVLLLTGNRAAVLLSQWRAMFDPHDPFGEIGYAIAGSALRVGGWAISWVVNVFAFAAIATAMKRVHEGIHPTAEECYAPARERVGTISLLALILFAFVLLSVVAGTLVTFALLKLFPDLAYRLVVTLSYGFTMLGLTVTATYGLSVPAAVLEPGIGVKAALVRSDFLTGNSFVQIFLLVVEGVASGYLATLLPYWSAGLIAQRVGWAAWENWVVWAIAAYGVAMADLVLLLGLTTLYLELNKSSQSAGAACSGR